MPFGLPSIGEINWGQKLLDSISAVKGTADTATSDLASHKADAANPHAVTKGQVGLGNVDNTSDANKPVSTAAQTALNTKQNIASLEGDVAGKVGSGGALDTALSASIDAVVAPVQADVNQRLTFSEAPVFLSASQLEVAAGVNEVQTVTITGSPTGGTFTLSFDGKVTSALAYNATATDVQTALRALANIGGSDVTVSGGPGPGTAWTVTFAGNLAAKDVPQLVAASLLTGGTSPAIAVATTVGGGPTLTKINNGSQYLTAWSLPKSGASSLTGTIPRLPTQAGGALVRVHLTASSDASASTACLRIIGGQLVPGTTLSAAQFSDNVMLVPLPIANSVQSKVVEAYLPIDDVTKPLTIRLIREVSQTLYDTWGGSINVYGIEVVPVAAPPPPVEVVAPGGQNTWPFLFSSGGNLVCVYSKGVQHDQPDTTRGVHARISTDDGATWGAEFTIRNTPGTDEAATSKGVDASGNLLLGIREGSAWHLYRSTNNGVTWTFVSTTTLTSDTNQVTDIFVVPTVGLMAFYFAGSYSTGTSDKSWGIVTSADDGATWTQTAKETALSTANWPTEPSGFYGGSGKIFAIARNETGDATTVNDSFFQLTSSNYGSTWSRNRTNVTDTYKSTPSILWDGAKAHLFYYRRIWGQLRRRVVTDPLNTVWGSSRTYPDPDVLAIGSRAIQDAGNCNAVLHNGKHKIAYYSGDATNTGIYIATVDPA